MSHALVPRSIAAAIALALALAALGIAASGAMASSAGDVYTLTNDPAGNAVKVFDRAGDGSLTEVGDFATGGAGTGGGLGNQSAVVVDGRRLFAVNPGSDSISSFAVKRDRLRLVDTDASGGDQPISLTVHRGLLYALNAGGAGNITGFTVARSGHLSPLARSTRPLSGDATGPAQVSFDPRGELLVVTEKDTNLIDTYEVGRSGRPGVVEPQQSAGATPFGFAFDRRGRLIVSEAFGGAADQSAVSSYAVDDGLIDPITPSAPTTETAACWIVVTDNGRFTYTTNTGSGSISGYRISRGGALSLLDADGRTAETGPEPLDMALSRGSRFLYSLNSGDGTISGFRVRADGGLTPIGGASGLPDGANGLAAR
ncbi:MAG: lactonase family protein [Solirubrobacterales bacterium]